MIVEELMPWPKPVAGAMLLDNIGRTETLCNRA